MIDFSSKNIRMWSRLGMCGTYGIILTELRRQQNEFVACTADLCFYSGLERFEREFPDDLYNVGIAEQNLIGVAGGLVKEEIDVFASTYASFATTRALDQVRVNMGYMQLPIKLIGLTSGFAVGILGPTHMCIEDVAIMRAIPNITIISPADTTEFAKILCALVDYKKPVYVRLTGTMNCPIIYKQDYEYRIGKAITLKEGKDIAIVSSGVIVSTCLKVANALQEHNISAAVIDMHTIKPLDMDCLKKLNQYKLVVSVEEHSIYGGLGATLAEYFAQIKEKTQLKIIGVEDEYPHAGEYEYVMKEYGLDADSITNKILKEWQERRI